MVPHLVTALTGPINALEQRILDSMPAIERWFRLEWMEHTPAFYSSADVRNAGFKLAPVSTNLFPSCWNNLLPSMLPLAVQAAMAAVEKFCPAARNLLIVPENKARNPFYLSNLAQLCRIFHMAGLHVRIGSISPDINTSTAFELPGGEKITLEPAMRIKGRLGVKDFDPCTILLNSHLRAGIPGILEDLNEQILLPPLHASSTLRSQSLHFRCYEEIAKRFGKLIGIDPWLIAPLFEEFSHIDLCTLQGRETLRSGVDALLAKIKKVYKEYSIKEKPFVVIKVKHNSHRMGTLTVHDTKDVENLCLQDRSGTKVSPETPQICDLILQEGVVTKEHLDAAVAEPVVYMMDRYVVGGFYRVHAGRGGDENLSAPGSSYVPLAFAESSHLPRPGLHPGASAPNRFYMYGVISRLAMLAASYELEATDPQAESYS